MRMILFSVLYIVYKLLRFVSFVLFLQRRKFLAILFSVFFIFSKKERKAKIAANTVSGLVCLILFNLFAPIKPGFGFFPITMASLLGVPAVLAMVVVKIS